MSVRRCHGTGLEGKSIRSAAEDGRRPTLVCVTPSRLARKPTASSRLRLGWQAPEEGVGLVRPGGVPTRLTKQRFERGLKA